MNFWYKVQLPSGEVFEKIEAFDSKEALFLSIKSLNGQLISVEERDRKNWILHLKHLLFQRGIKEEAKITFARNISTMLEAGLPLSRTLAVMERQTKSVKLKLLISDLILGINEGKSLSDMLAEHSDVFSSLFISMVKSGEESGDLVHSFKVIADQLERSYTLKKKVKGAMMYPGIIISAMIIIGILMMMYVVPTLTATFKELNVTLPLSTQVIIGISDAMKNHSILVFVGIFIFIAGSVTFTKSEKGRRLINSFSLKIPMIGNLVKEVNSARTATTLSSLLKAGVEFVRALEITEEVVQNHHYKAVISKMRESVKSGGVMSDILKVNESLYPPLVAEMVAVGEETGKVADLLARVGQFYESDVEEQTKNMSTIIEPFLMVLIGGVVGYFAISMIGPMYSLSSSI